MPLKAVSVEDYAAQQSQPKKLKAVPVTGPTEQRLVAKPVGEVTHVYNDMTYVPGDTEQDYAAWKKWYANKDEEPFTMDQAWQIVSSMAGELAQGGKAALSNAVAGEGMKIINSLGEGILRGTADLGIMTHKIMDKATRDDELTRERFRGWREIRKLEAMREKARTGEEDLIDHLAWRDFQTDDVDVDPALAEGASYFLDVGTVGAPVAQGITKATGVSGRAVARGAAIGAGKAMEATGSAIDAAKGAVAERFPRVADSIGTLKNVATGAGVIVDPLKTAAGRIAVEAADRIGPFGSALTKAVEDLPLAPTNMGVMERVSKNSALPTRVREAAAQLRPLDPAIRAGSDLAQGATGGALIGAGMGAASEDNWQQGAFSGAAGAAVAGAGGSAFGKGVDYVTGASDTQRMQNSVNLFRREHGGNTEVFDTLNRGTQENIVAAAELLRGKVGVQVLDTDAYRQKSTVKGAVGHYDPSTKTIYIDGNSNAPKETLLHEVGEAMWDSGVVDVGAIREAMTRMYGDMETMRRGYAESMLREESGKKPSPEDIDAKLQELDNKTYAGEKDWVIREAFAEHFMAESAGPGLHDYIRKSKLQRAIQSAGRVLGEDVKLGLDPLSKTWTEAKFGVQNALSILAGGEGLNSLGYGQGNIFGTDLQKNTKLSKAYKKYSKQLDRQYRAMSAGKEVISTHSLDPAKPSPIDFGGVAKDFVTTAADGTRSVKPRKEIVQQLQDNRKATRQAVDNMPLESSDTATVGVKYTYNNDGSVNQNKTEVRGRVMQDSLRDMPGFENMRGTVDTINSAIESGRVLKSNYLGIGTTANGDSWVRSLTRNKGNIPASEQRYLPYEWLVNKNGNRLVRVVNLDQVAARAKQWQDSGKIRLWNGDVDAFLHDARKYLENHRDGRPGKTGLSDEKHNIVNAFFQGNNTGKNPFYRHWDSGTDRIFRSLRLERIGSIEDTSPNGTPFGTGPFDHLKVKQMLSPTRFSQQAYEKGQVNFSPSKVSDEANDLRVGTSKLGTSAKPAETPATSNISGEKVPIKVLEDHLSKMDYDHVPESVKNIQDLGKKREAYIDWMVENLLALHDAFPADLREAATLWYDGANKIAKGFASTYNYKPQQAAGVLAVLSPQKNWFMNVAQAEQVMDIWRNHQNTVLSQELIGKQMEDIISAAAALPSQRKKAKTGESPLARKRRQNYNRKQDQKAQQERRDNLSRIVGKTISELSGNKTLQAWAIRILAQSIHGREYRVINPDGTPMHVDLKKDGVSQKNGWGSTGEIVKAVSILENGSLQNISERLGNEHKVRNFYNNIIAPNNPFGDATIDTHAVAAAHLQPYGANSQPVTHNFGGGVKGFGSDGISGTYHIYLDAYKKAAALRGLMPRQMQSITWEAVRLLYPPESRRDKSIIANANRIWKSNNSETARKEIVGGTLPAPSWAGTINARQPKTSSEGLQKAGQELQPGGGLLFRGGGYVNPDRVVPPTTQIRFSPARQLNNRGGAIYTTPQGHRAVQTSSRAGVRVYDSAGKRVGPVFQSVEKAQDWLAKRQ